MKKNVFPLIKKNILTDFVFGDSIYKIPHFFLKEKKKYKIIKINENNIDFKKIEIYWGTRINDKLLKKLTNLKWIHFGSSGTDKVHYKLIKKKKVIVTNSAAINSNSVSNLILVYLLDTEKKLLVKKYNKIETRNIYEKYFKYAQDLENQNILILGYGNIAKNLIKKLEKLNIKYQIFSRRNLKRKNIINENKLYKNLNKYDTIINLLKLNKDNLKFISNFFFKKIKKNINLILAGRIQTIDLNSLYNFLKSNKNSFAYIDAEMKGNEVTLLKKINLLKNSYITPHIGGYFKNYWKYQSKLFYKNLSLYINNKKLINDVRINKNNFL
jgi:glycerate dehydrogenase